MHSLILKKAQLQKMISHVEFHAPLESCGLLAGRFSTVEEVILVTNQAHSPERFMMEPIEQLQAFEWIETKGLELMGIFHSHPNGPETVSPTDIAQAAYPVVHVILSSANRSRIWKSRGFWIENRNFYEVTLDII